MTARRRVSNYSREGQPLKSCAKLLCPRPAGLYCPPGDFYIDPVRPLDRAVITHAHGDHARSSQDKRSGYHSDFTFGVWAKDDDALPAHQPHSLGQARPRGGPPRHAGGDAGCLIKTPPVEGPP